MVDVIDQKYPYERYVTNFKVNYFLLSSNLKQSKTKLNCRIIEMYLPMNQLYASKKRKIHKKKNVKHIQEFDENTTYKENSNESTTPTETATISSFDDLSSSAASTAHNDHIYDKSNINRI